MEPGDFVRLNAILHIARWKYWSACCHKLCNMSCSGKKVIMSKQLWLKFSLSVQNCVSFYISDLYQCIQGSIIPNLQGYFCVWMGLELPDCGKRTFTAGYVASLLKRLWRRKNTLIYYPHQWWSEWKKKERKKSLPKKRLNRQVEIFRNRSSSKWHFPRH